MHPSTIVKTVPTSRLSNDLRRITSRAAEVLGVVWSFDAGLVVTAIRL
jgi:hypothetical protein